VSPHPKPINIHVYKQVVDVISFSLVPGLCSLVIFLLQVTNVVPSISAITGGFTPERYIWRYGMAYFSWPRTFDSFLIYGFFAASSLNRNTWYSILNKISWLCYVVEHVSLFTLTYVSSTENYG